MRLLVLIAFILLGQMAQALANCQVYVPVKEFDNSGYVITFDFTKMFHDKNYTEVYSPDVADLRLNLEGTEQEGRFHHAVATMGLGSYKVQESVTCYTQFCGISDYGKAFNKAYKKLSQTIPACH
jgi:hypothetical protein